jgi:aminoglycoside phosphotransferase family enzyme/predicted kinase
MKRPFLISLQKPGAYPEPTNFVRLLQTHVSFLFITDNFVYKIKKPVDFGFLNFTTLDRRRFYCNEEVRLNRRLCPDIYIGVVELRESASGVTFSGEGNIIDYAVKMKRLPEERMLDRMLAEGKVTETDIRKIARVIATFHLNAVHDSKIDEYGSSASIRQNWEENFRQIEEFVNISLTKTDLVMLKKWVENFMSANDALFAKRVTDGFIRDCDGDIHLENICLTSNICIFDCIEFNDRFRYIDTAADIAFLLMDLDFHDKSAFSADFLDEYTVVTGDLDFMRLLDFYKIYRAVVRGKVESLKLFDVDIPEAAKNSARDKAVRYFRLARGYVIRQWWPPAIIITCGMMGSGKSAIASALGLELGMAIASSDAVRKELAGIPRDRHCLDEYDKGIYTATFTEATYRELQKRAEEALQSGRSIIVDATFRRKEERTRFANLAARHNAPFHIVHTVCPERVVKHRLDERSRKPGEISDGRWELFNRQKNEFEPPGEDEVNLISIDTSRPIYDNIDDILHGMEKAYGTQILNKGAAASES